MTVYTLQDSIAREFIMNNALKWAPGTPKVSRCNFVG